MHLKVGEEGCQVAVLHIEIKKKNKHFVDTLNQPFYMIYSSTKRVGEKYNGIFKNKIKRKSYMALKNPGRLDLMI
jgi:hypothetical protein